LPNLAGAMNIIIIRTFIKDIANELIEAAKIDGAGELRTFMQIVLPLSKPALATVAFIVMLDRWNDWFTALLYIQDERLYTLQYLLQKILREAEFIRNMVKDAPAGLDLDFLEKARNMPTEGMRYALCIVAAGPMLVVFPLFQKYFVKGLTIGAVKG
jgi:putative aldouronate transport system permease protein